MPFKRTQAIQETRMAAESPFESSPWTEDSTRNYSAIQDCPVEILTEIFMRYLEDKGCQIKHLLFVCKDWYHLLIHTPLFWTKITLLSSPTRTAVDQLHYLKICMQRSRDMLLDIDVDYRRPMVLPEAEQRNYRLLVELLSGGIHRCKVLQITLPHDINFSHIVCHLFKGPATNMVELSIRNFRFRSQQLVSFSELPSLRILEIDMYALMNMLHLHHSLPLAGLHSLDLDLFGAAIWAELNGFSDWRADISLLRSLRSLQIRNTSSLGRTVLKSSSQSISLPLLQNLGLWGLDQAELRLVAPSLRTLSFDGTCFPKTDPIEVVWRPGHGMNTGMHAVKDLLFTYRSAKIFVLPSWTEGLLVDALQLMRKEGVVLDSGMSFIKESKDGRREPVKIDESVQNSAQIS